MFFFFSPVVIPQPVAPAGSDLPVGSFVPLDLALPASFALPASTGAPPVLNVAGSGFARF